MLNENIKAIRKSKGLSQQELAIKLNVVRQTISKWEQGLSVPDSDMLISISEVLETPVSTLLGETVIQAEADNLKAISEKLEVINLQLAQRKTARRKMIRWLLISLCVIIIMIFTALAMLNSPYLGWDYSDPETAVLGVAFHSFEWLFVSRVYGESYGYLTAVELAGFAGMTAGGLLAACRGQSRKKTRTLRNSLTVFGTMAILMAVSCRFLPYLLLMGVYGVALTGVQTALTTLLQERTGVSMQGRIFGLFSSMYSGFMPLGMAVFGPLADHIPLRILMIFSGAALIGLGKCSCAIKYPAKRRC